MCLRMPTSCLTFHDNIRIKSTDIYIGLDCHAYPLVFLCYNISLILMNSIIGNVLLKVVNAAERFAVLKLSISLKTSKFLDNQPETK